MRSSLIILDHPSVVDGKGCARAKYEVSAAFPRKTVENGSGDWGVLLTSQRG
jgi:hypothetical protein